MNKLQFIHCDTLFGTREEAKAYVNGDLVQISRPALYAEPMVLKYGDAENPNILLAIGSVGDGTTPSLKNKVFFIDFADLEESVAEIKSAVDSEKTDITDIKETIVNILASCGFDEYGSYKANSSDEVISEAKSLNEADVLLSKAIKDNYDDLLDKINAIEHLNVKDSRTISHKLTSDGKEITLQSGVNLSKNMVVGDKLVENIIVKQDDGLFVNVRMAYDESENKLSFSVNDTTKDFNLPKENHVVGCEYDTKSESLVFTFKEPINDKGETTMYVDMGKLIGEWTVLGENADTPIVLKKEPVKSNDLLHGADIYQDVLTADVRIASQDYKPYNILKKTDDNKFLYVDGTAKNIKYWKNGKLTTVKDALDEMECSVSSEEGNIIYKKVDGIFASVDFDYNEANNEIVFKKTNKEGHVEVSRYQLSNKSFLDNIRYDSGTEEIVITYKDGNGIQQVVKFPVTALFNEWETDNANHTVTLVKSEHNVNGKDKLSADVNISNAPNNILDVVGNGLYVNGSAENIKYDETRSVKTVLEAINAPSDVEGSFRNMIKAEADARVAADDVITAKVGENEEAIAKNLSHIKNEIKRAKAEEQRIEGKFDGEFEDQKTANENFVSEISNIKNKVKAEITRSTEKDAELEAKINEHDVSSKVKFDELEANIGSVAADLTTERNNRISNVKALENSINSEVKRAENAEKELDGKIASISGTVDSNLASISELATSIENETARAQEVEKSISDYVSLVDGKANINASSIEKLKESFVTVSEHILANEGLIADEIERAKAAEKALNDTIVSVNEKVNSVGAKTVENKAAIDELSQKLVSEISDRKSADDEIKGMIAESNVENKFNVADTSTLRLDKTITSSGNVLKGNVIISNEDGNIIRDDNGIFASVDLEYNAGSNMLTLTTSGFGSKSILLNSGSLVKAISYDATSKELVITYDSTDGSKDNETRVDVQDLFNEWVVDNKANSAIQLTKKHVGSNQPDVLTADVKLSTLDSNLIQKDKGSLYASNSAYDIKFPDGSNVGDKLVNVGNNITELNTKVDNAVNEVNNMRNEVNTIRTDVNNMKTDITTINTKIENVNSTVTDLGNRVTKVEGDVTTINNNISNITNNVDNIENKVENIDNRVDTIENNVTDITTKVDNITEQIESGSLNISISGSTSKTVETTVEKDEATTTYTVKSNVKISAEEGNVLIVKDDGLYIDASYDLGTY